MEEKRIVEIDGVKIEVDLRTAKRIDTFRVGDNVKVLCKEYNGDFTVEATAFDRETGEVDTDMLNRCFAAIREGVKR